MADWAITLVAVIITAIIAPIVVRRFAPKWQRRKTEAETESEVAETVVALTAAWEKLLTTTQERLEVAEAGNDLRDEEIRNRDAEIADLREQNALLYEQKVACVGQNLVLSARLAGALDVDVLNSEARGSAGGK